VASILRQEPQIKPPSDAANLVMAAKIRGCTAVAVHAQNLATQWMWVYNNERPHSSIGGIPPKKLLEAI